MSSDGFGVSRERLRARLDARVAAAGHPVPVEPAGQLARYLELLSTWNERMNLTALRELDTAIDRLIIEPLLASRHVGANTAVMDIGSGGGSPAIPLKVLVPSISLCMVEVKTRKSAFLREVARDLGLSAVRVETRRFEDLLVDPTYRGVADLVTVRAVRLDVPALMDLQSLLCKGGRVLLFGSAGDVIQVSPPFELEAELPLVDALKSRLSILRMLP